MNLTFALNERIKDKNLTIAYGLGIGFLKKND